MRADVGKEDAPGGNGVAARNGAPGACDPTTGERGSAGAADAEGGVSGPGQRVEVVYVTDPLCSACWVMEPTWRKLLYHHGEKLTVRYLYGGLLPSWEEMARAGAPIASPADVAVHWEEVAERVAQPISSGVWRWDPIPSSYPASEAAHAVRILAPHLETAFLYRLRVAAFVEERNVARREVLLDCANDAGMDTHRFASSLDAKVGEEPFRRDLREASHRGARVLPTLLLHGTAGSSTLVGGRPYEELEAIVRGAGNLVAKAVPSAEEALRSYGLATLAELSALTELPMGEARRRLEAAGARRIGREDELWTAPEAIGRSGGPGGGEA